MPVDPLTPPRSRAVRALLVLVLAAVFYAPSLRNGFTFDDHTHIEQNAWLRSGSGIAHLWLDPITEGETLRGHVYRPLAATLQSAIGRAFGFTPITFHAASLLLYAALAFLLHEALVFVVEPRLSWITTILFLAHPVHSEAVASATASTELLAGLFMVASWGLLWMPGGSWRFSAAALAILSGLLCKETVVVLALVGVLGNLLRGAPRREVLASLVVPVLPLILYFSLRYHVIGRFLAASEVAFAPLDNPLVELPAWDRAGNGLVLLVRSLLLLAWPASLSADYSLASLPLVKSPWPVVAAGALFAGLAAWAWRERRRRPAVTLGIAVFFLGLLPGANLFFVSATIFAERHLLLPALGIALPLAWLLARAIQPRAAGAVLAIILLACAVRVWVRLPAWHDDLTLFRATAATLPTNAKAHYNIAQRLQKDGDLQGALPEAEAAVSIHPRYGDARVVLAQLLAATGDPDRALRVAEEGVAAVPRHEALWNQLGVLRLQRGDRVAARAAFSAGFARMEGSWLLPWNAALIDLEAGRLDTAEPLLRHVVARNDFPEAQYALGHVLLERGFAAEARPALEKGLNAKGWAAQARVDLALAHLALGDARAALAVLGTPQTPQAALAGAAALARVGRAADAKRVLQQLGITAAANCPPEATALGRACRSAL
jgi:protein O-mannosyl-transferase